MPSVLIEHDGPVLRLTLNRPEVRNAFDEEVIQTLSAAAFHASEDRTIRAIVLAGNGKAFCAGADIGWMAKAIAYSRQENLSDAEDLARLLERLDTLPVPVIGRIQGSALGGGVGLAAICDIAIAAEDAVFALSEVKLGILPAVVAPYVLRKIGISAARELFLTGARFDAARAREMGLVHALNAFAAIAPRGMHLKVAAVVSAAYDVLLKPRRHRLLEGEMTEIRTAILSPRHHLRRLCRLGHRRVDGGRPPLLHELRDNFRARRADELDLAERSRRNKIRD